MSVSDRTAILIMSIPFMMFMIGLLGIGWGKSIKRWTNSQRLIDNGYYSRAFGNFVDGARRFDIFSYFNWFLMPISFCYMIGAWFGRKMYNILIDNNDENRLASWLF